MPMGGLIGCNLSILFGTWKILKKKINFIPVNVCKYSTAIKIRN